MADNLKNMDETKGLEEILSSVKLDLDGRGVDWFLQDLVNFANSSDDFEFGITLHVGGAVISGTLIGAPKYYDLFADLFAGKPKEGEPSWLHEWITRQKVIYKPESDEPTRPPSYIHLSDARSFSVNGAIPGNEGVLWRGRISAVSGFNLGLLSTESRSV